MSYIKISNINLHKQTLHMPGGISKNRESATVTLPAKVIHLMLELEIFNNPTNYYLFSDDFKLGKDYKYSKQFTDFWAFNVRQNLNFPAKYQFHSLKDTGITEMLRKYDTLTVRDQARHCCYSWMNPNTYTFNIFNNRDKDTRYGCGMLPKKW